MGQKNISRGDGCPGHVAQLIRASSQFAKVGFYLWSGHAQEATNECI